MFWSNKKFHFKKSQTYHSTNNHFPTKVTFKGYVWYVSANLFLMSKTAFFKQKNAFHFIPKALLLLQIFKFKNFRILNFKTSSNAYAWNKKCILLNNLGGKHSLVMTFVKFMWYYKNKNKKKNFHQGILQTPVKHILIFEQGTLQLLI